MDDQDRLAGARSNLDVAPTVGAADTSSVDVHPRTVIVPRRPGPLREYQPRSPRPHDELDDLIDELLGPATDEKPGRFDVGLVVAGLSLLTWATQLGGPSLALWIGIAAMVLGLALPARALLRRFDSSPTGGPRRRIVDRGLLLDASHPTTQGLIGAYERLMQMPRVQGVRDPKQAIAAGHAAVVEVARCLDGQPPDTPAKAQLVLMRTDALAALAHQMQRSDGRYLVGAASQTRPQLPQTHWTPPPAPVERRWVPPRHQAGSPDPRRAAANSGRRP